MGLIIYVNWENIYSFFVNVLALIALSWLSDLTVSKRKGYFFIERERTALNIIEYIGRDPG